MGTIYAKNKIYSGNDGINIGFQVSSSFSSSAFSLVKSGNFYLSYTSSVVFSGSNYLPFSGSFQELRFYNTNLSESNFNDYVMNPYSFEGNEIEGDQSSLNSLIFRAPLGTLLDNGSDTTRTSIHPRISTNPVVDSFNVTGSSYYYLSGSYTFLPQYETIYQNQANIGIKNQINKKLSITDIITPTGSTLSKYISVQQSPSLNTLNTFNTNYIEIGFSPQYEINDDIISQLGSFNIGEYIGDPSQLYSSSYSYPDLDNLKELYFSKYKNKYNLLDYMKVSMFYDNSLFKMIKDFIPSRAGLSTGIIIKQTILERNKYPRPKINSDSSLFFVGNSSSRTLNIPL